jgi:hypothetical protein
MPFVFYVHPWEIDPGQPKLPAGSHLARFRHRVNLSRTHKKLNQLLAQFRFGSLSDAVKSAIGSSPELSSQLAVEANPKSSDPSILT